MTQPTKTISVHKYVPPKCKICELPAAYAVYYTDLENPGPPRQTSPKNITPYRLPTATGWACSVEHVQLVIAAMLP